jgi:hypothetical protein
MNELLAPLGSAIAASAIGAVVWRYHRVDGAHRSAATRRASLLVTSGVALAAAASGVGVVVNATLAIAVSPLAGGGMRTLLLGGISSLIVGGLAWWQAWKPTGPPQTGDAIPTGRRVYLIVFFGISAVVALIALLVIGYRLFEYVLGDVTGGSLVDRVRASIGVVVAAGVVAAYHFSLWRRERTLLSVSPTQRAAIGQVTLVTGSHAEQLSRAIVEATGAKVVLWKRADGRQETDYEAGAPGTGVLIERVTRALSGVAAKHVLLVIGPDSGSSRYIEVIPLETGGTTR